MRSTKAKGELGIASVVAYNWKALGTLSDYLEQVQGFTSLPSSHLARFKLWSASLGAHHATGHRALEYRLRDASSIKNYVLDLLRKLSTAIDQAQASAQRQPDQLHDDSALDEIDAYFLDDVTPLTPLDRSLAEIGHILDCLLRLSATISNPAPHDHFQSRIGSRVEHYEPYDLQHVQGKFKDINTAIAERLGRAVTMRRHYFEYRKEHHEKLAAGLGDIDDTGGDKTTIASSIPEQSKDAPGNTPLLEGLRLDSPSEFSTTSYATSSAESGQLKVPPIPTEHLDGPFLCPFCQMITEIQRRRDWKEHVFRDLRPYVCVEKLCSIPARLYARRSEWIDHMKREHWKTWSCTLGCSETFPTGDAWKDHNRTAHSQEMPLQELEILQAGSIRQDLSKAEGKCPLCLTFEMKNTRDYGSHIGDHLESLALFSLPKIAESDDTDEGVEVKSDPDPENEANDPDDSSSFGGEPTTSLKGGALQNFELNADLQTEPDIQKFQSHSSLAQAQDGPEKPTTQKQSTATQEAVAKRKEIDARIREGSERAFLGKQSKKRQEKH